MTPHIPPPTPVAIQLLNDLPSIADSIGGRISVVLDSTLPALRVALVGYQDDSATDWEAVPMDQIEVWTVDEIEAEEIAWDIANTWTTATRQIIGQAAIHGRWVVQKPAGLPARMTAGDSDEDTNLARYSLTVAFRLTGVTP